MEVVSLIGEFALTDDGKPAIHAHADLSRSDGSVLGGHLIGACVRPTLEVVLTQSPKHLHKRRDPESGLVLIDLAQ